MDDKQVKIAITPNAFDLICWGIALLAIVYAAVSITNGYAELPERIPIHFDAQGRPDGYGSRLTIFIVFIIQISLAIGLWFLARIPHWHNYMVKITEENVSRQYANSMSMLNAINAIITSFFAFMIKRDMMIAVGEVSSMGSYSTFIFLGGIFFVTIYFVWRSSKLK